MTARMTPNELAQACAEKMWADDRASQQLGMTLDAVTAGAATLSMAIRDDMVNGHGNAHGGFIFSLADSAFAFACNSRNERAVAQACDIVFAAPARLGVVPEVTRCGQVLHRHPSVSASSTPSTQTPGTSRLRPRNSASTGPSEASLVTRMS